MIIFPDFAHYPGLRVEVWASENGTVSFRKQKGGDDDRSVCTVSDDRMIVQHFRHISQSAETEYEHLHVTK